MKTKIGAKPLSVREERRMSQEEFAHLLDSSSSTYGRLERNETSLEIDQMIRIANKLEVLVQEFLPDTMYF